VLPLVVGLGVDGGVHIIHDFRSQLQDRPYTPSASVINAMFVNATTTMVGFGSMMIAAHRGLYSLGLVLTIGVGTCLLVSIVLVPAILTWITRRRGATGAAQWLPDELPETFPDGPDAVPFLRAAEVPELSPADDDDAPLAA